MSGLEMLGILLLVYGAFCIYTALARPQAIWKWAKVQSFVHALGDTGAVIFFFVWGAAAAVGGALLLV